MLPLMSNWKIKLCINKLACGNQWKVIDYTENC